LDLINPDNNTVVIVTSEYILSAVAIPQVTKFIASGKTSAAKAELALVNTDVTP
jgi:Tfp pilus assembly major pilin PilA